MTNAENVSDPAAATKALRLKAIKALRLKSTQALRRMRGAVSPKATAKTDTDPVTSAVMALTEVLSHARNALLGDGAGRIALTHMLLEEAEHALVGADPFGELGLYTAGAQLVEAARLCTTDVKLPHPRIDVAANAKDLSPPSGDHETAKQLVARAMQGKIVAERRRAAIEDPLSAGGTPGRALPRESPMQPWLAREHLRTPTTGPDVLAKTMRKFATRLRRLGQGETVPTVHSYEINRRTLDLINIFASMLANPPVAPTPETAAQIAEILEVAVHTNSARPAIPINPHGPRAARLAQWANAIRDELIALEIQERLPLSPKSLAHAVVLRILREQGVKKPSARLDRERKSKRKQ